IDGGTTWGRPILDAGVNIYNLDVSGRNPNRVIAGAFTRGVHVSEDAGATWVQGVGITGNVYRAFYTDAHPDRAWALTSDGVFRSDNGGRNWVSVGQIRIGGAIKHTFEIEVSPWDANTVYSLSIDGDLVVTRNGGSSWQIDDDGLPKDPECNICEEIQHLVFDGRTPGQTYIAGGVLGDGVEPQSMWIYQREEPGTS
ncbi:MAG TPA: hypothetical protein VM840_11275, partial [Actinomycetota bacterium]|nr:hypothetical protein [Actinomycetota bacterium]